MSANTAQSHDHLVDLKTTVAPDFVAHWVVKTARSKEMIAWYRTVFGARVVHEDQKLAFLTWDEESHRLALVKVPSFMRYAFPLAKLRRKFYGVDHIGLSFRSLERLLLTYERLKKVGITPVWSINHGPTTSLYYEDPDGIRLEFQTENFPTAGETAQYFCSSAFAENPIGVNIDPDYLLERLRSGTEAKELLRQGAGTRPGTNARANKRAITWKTL
jgi:catechol 2,3-dioxygenase-like lactoylglutathione lyase family enzyme